LGSGARFVARGIDVHKNLPDVLKAAHAHKGAASSKSTRIASSTTTMSFAGFTNREVAADKQLWLKAGEKMLFAAAPRASRSTPSG
jgi:2-oxoglutarate ferredoxin oxidoreductase subunit beta